jgi:hypothetical protein
MAASTYTTTDAYAASMQGQIDAIKASVGTGGGTNYQSQIDALAASIPQPATAMPPGVADNGATGTDTRYALANHTHASKVRKQIKTMPSASATYTWTFADKDGNPLPFGTGVVPIVSALVQVPSGNTDLFNVQILGVPTNTQATFQINRVSSGLLSLLSGALSVNPTPVAATLHLIALEP